MVKKKILTMTLWTMVMNSMIKKRKITRKIGKERLLVKEVRLLLVKQDRLRRKMHLSSKLKPTVVVLVVLNDNLQ
jgi:hypothetical protein